jgi:cellulose synthase operon protein C
MFFSFADYETLRLTLTSGAVPPEVSGVAVAASFEEGRICVRPSREIPSPSQVALRRLGVKASSKQPATPLAEYTCWVQLLPLEREPGADAIGPQTPVLFEVGEPHTFAALVGEILRLGNDRQAFRWIQGPPDDPGERALLRVVGPPYYSLLRALDREGGQGVNAYVERSPGVWVQVGHRHPLQEMLRPPAGHLLLLRPPRDWQAVEERPYQDVYEVLEFPAPAGRAWNDIAKPERLKVPLRLVRASTSEPAELWVVRDRPVEQLDELVRNADDQILSRLAFAVGEASGQEIVALRVRPGRKQAPPVLVLDAQAYRSYLRLPNLFLPVQTRLRPPLRRDAVRQYLAEDAEQIHWLAPGPEGSFTVETFPDSAFRPLSDWILYVLDHERRPLLAWVQSATFEFDAFVCREQRPPREKKARTPKEDSPPREDGMKAVRAAPPKEEKKPAKEVEPRLKPQKVSPSELQVRARDLESRFLEIHGPPDAPGRQELWRQLAEVYTALDSTADALVCGVNAQWPNEETPVPFPGGAAAQGWVVNHLGKLLQTPRPAQQEIQRLAACLLALGPSGAASAMKDRLDAVQHFLQGHEAQLPVRAVWLLGLALAKAAGGEVLALARTRDRLLERLYQNGLSAEQDLPTFLRFSSATSSDRMRRFRDWLLALPERLHRWIDASSNVAGPSRPPAYPSADPRKTGAYADLLLAFGLARLGDARASRRLKERACEVLGDIDNVHSFLLAAFDHRIQQALDGKAVSGALPRDFFDLLPAPDGQDPGTDARLRLDRLKADRLRQKSRVLEPHEALNAYDRFLSHRKDPLGQALARLSDITDKAELERQVRAALDQAAPRRKKEKSERPRVLRAALAVAPRLGEEFALEILGQVEVARSETTDVEVQADLLEKALVLSAHFEQSDYVRLFVSRYHEFLKRDQAEIARHGEALAGQCFRGLRKYGLREEIEALMRELTEALTQGQPPEALRGRADWPALLRTLLHVAAGWFFFGKDKEALELLGEARAALYGGGLSREDTTQLACRYAGTLGQAPADVALQGIDEMLDRLEGVYDNFSTWTHFSLSQLQVVEAIVLGVVTEDFALGGEVRRWLDDDEYLVRRRIHHDLQDFLKKAGH